MVNGEPKTTWAPWVGLPESLGKEFKRAEAGRAVR
jgi:hypothetical protein